MKKSLLAVGLTLTMVLAMATPAFAVNTNTNVNVDGTLVTAPGHPDYAAGNVQVAGESFNEASITNKTGINVPTVNDWEVVNDDDAIAKAADIGADINVWAKVVDSGSKIYKVDLAWGAMKFEYTNTTGQWNTTTHEYNSTGGTKGWTVATYLEGVNNKVTVTNHSNNGINAAFAYAMNGEKFNDAAGKDNVVGNFFDTIDKAKTAATVLADTYDATGTTLSPTAVTGKLAAPIALPTADAYNDGTNNQLKGARESAVYFAFSGAPDSGKGKILDTFKKVGVITVTVTPNDDVNLNKPVATP